jgi:outer membrane murein-binding lipoprotein Lpp
MAVALISGGLFVGGCSSSPSDEELAQLDALRREVASLQGKVDEARRDKAGMEKQIAEKNGKIQQCQADQEAVKKGLGK